MGNAPPSFWVRGRGLGWARRGGGDSRLFLLCCGPHGQRAVALDTFKLGYLATMASRSFSNE